ncbi:MAG: hypothetical protein AAFO57_00410 [Pseudomonadota bacterium]
MKDWKFFVLVSIAYVSPKMSNGAALVCSLVAMALAALSYWEERGD